MIVTNYTDARAGLKKLMDRVVEDCDEAIITRQRGEPVVMISLSAWQAIDETNYLLSSAANARELRESIAEYEAGKAEPRELIGP